MMTQTHGLIAAALLAHSGRPSKHNAAILFGSFVPDAAIYCLFIWSKFAKIPEQHLWQKTYFSEPMLTFTAIGNSLPLYLCILLAAMVIGWLSTEHNLAAVRARVNDWAFWRLTSMPVMALFALAAISHLIGDFPVHAADAHPHFWPFTNWRFHSPVSYWDPSHYGHIFSYAEAALGLILSLVIFRRFKVAYVRLLIVLLMCVYVAVPLYFSTMS